ncbi:ribosome-recycling factor, mitochondrial [Lepisosteus oculatus]|uniref:ribosome-recycling factor, mitochondrial n=1 Tax=Lepisosteus oculatus TaxID=7918 RepID=UPI0037109006
MALSRVGLLRAAWSRSLPALVGSPLESTTRRLLVLPHSCQQCGGLLPAQKRHYATKKSKAKSKGQAKVNINSALVEDIINLEEVKDEMNAVVVNLKEDYSRNLSIRTSPGALDHITVSTKDGKFPLNQLGQISMTSNQVILVNMTSFPEATAAATRALRESGMNLNPEVDGTVIRVPVPKVTREHRENLAKLAKQFTNKAKESLRKVRTNALNQVKKSKDTVSEDTIKLIEKQIQQLADGVAVDLDNQLAIKTKELLG